MRTKEEIETDIAKAELLLSEAINMKKKEKIPHIFMAIMGGLGMSYANTEMGGMYGIMVGVLSLSLFGYAFNALITTDDSFRFDIDENNRMLRELNSELDNLKEDDLELLSNIEYEDEAFSNLYDSVMNEEAIKKDFTLDNKSNGQDEEYEHDILFKPINEIG